MPFDVQLPIRYDETSTMMAAFSASARRLQLLTPEPLKVVEVWPGRGALTVACFDYVRTTVGPYGEVAICWPVIDPQASPLKAPPLLPLMFEQHWPGLAYWIHRLPVTTEIARFAGRSIWGYPKHMAAIDYSWEGATRRCVLTEGGQRVLELSVDTRMPALPRKLALRTFSILDGELLTTRVDIDAVGLRRRLRAHARLSFGPHPAGRELAELDARVARPVEVRWFPVWRAVLPAAESRRRLAPPSERAAAGAA